MFRKIIAVMFVIGAIVPATAVASEGKASGAETVTNALSAEEDPL